MTEHSEGTHTDEPIHITASRLNVNLPFTFGSEEAERSIMDTLEAVARAAFRDGVEVGIRAYYEHGGRPRTIASASRKVIQRDDAGQIVAIVDEVLT